MGFGGAAERQHSARPPLQETKERKDAVGEAASAVDACVVRKGGRFSRASRPRRCTCLGPSGLRRLGCLSPRCKSRRPWVSAGLFFCRRASQVAGESASTCIPSRLTPRLPRETPPHAHPSRNVSSAVAAGLFAVSPSLRPCHAATDDEGLLRLVAEQGDLQGGHEDTNRHQPLSPVQRIHQAVRPVLHCVLARHHASTRLLRL